MRAGLQAEVTMAHADITESKFVCQMLRKAKIQNVGVWSKERFID